MAVLFWLIRRITLSLSTGMMKQPGLFHCNLGWGGVYDGWYSLSSLPAGLGSVEEYISNIYIDSVAPDAPSNITYTVFAAGNDGAVNDVKFSWEEPYDDYGVASYIFQIDDNSDFSSYTGITSDTVDASYFNFEAGVYYIRVSAVDTFGNESEWSVVQTITLEEPPTTPDGLTNSVAKDNVSLDWANSTDDYSGVSYYVVEYSADYRFTDAVSVTVAGSALSLDGLDNGIWYWRVKAVDGSGYESDWSDTETFILSVGLVGNWRRLTVRRQPLRIQRLCFRGCDRRGGGFRRRQRQKFRERVCISLERNGL